MRTLCACILAALFFIACGGEEKKNTAPLEIIGTYGDDWGGTHIITATIWDMALMGKFAVTKFDNVQDFLVAHNDAANDYNPGKWSRMDWVWSGEKLYFCQIVYDKNSAADAEAATGADPQKLDTGCNGAPWSALTPLVFAGAVGTSDCPAISKDDPRIAGWATGHLDPVWGDNLTEDWKQPDKALGPAEGNATAVVSLGEGGSITLTFDEPLSDGAGYDLAVFENSFSDEFLELAFVEVSSDGTTFARFENSYLAADPVAEYGTLDPTRIDGLAGKYRAGWGTPFDLATLAGESVVLNGAVDLSSIIQVRIVDICGDGSQKDSAGRAVYDPYPTHESAGFDLDGVGIIQ